MSCHKVKFLSEQVFVQSCKSPTFFVTHIPTPKYLFPCTFCHNEPVFSCTVSEQAKPAKSVFFILDTFESNYGWEKADFVVLAVGEKT